MSVFYLLYHSWNVLRRSLGRKSVIGREGFPAYLKVECMVRRDESSLLLSATSWLLPLLLLLFFFFPQLNVTIFMSM